MIATAEQHPDPLTRRRRLPPAIAADPEVLPAVLAIGVFVFWALSDGGVAPTDSYPGALLMLGILCATALGFRSRLSELPPLALLAGGLLAVFVVWNFASILWADDQGAAWDGANRCLLYLIVFTTFAIPRWSGGAAAFVLGLYAAALAATGAITVISAAASADPAGYLIADRFSDPTGYHNANAALFTLGSLPALMLASRSEVPSLLRGLMLASAGVLLQCALLPQSRGWLVAAPIAFLLYLLVTPDRIRVLIAAAPLAVVLGLTASPMLHVFDAASEGSGLVGALDDARSALLIGAAALFGVGTAIGLLDRRIDLGDRTTRIASRTLGALAWVGALVGVVVAIVIVGNPFEWIGDRWQDFKTGQSPAERAERGSSRLTQGLGSDRYDFWRVAFDQFEAAPLIGAGTENFAEDYVAERHSDEEPTHPHSLPLRILGQTGVIGGLLFLGFLVAALTAIVRVRLRAPTPLARAGAAAVIATFAYWLLHSSGDWFWAFPALTAPVFAFLAAGARTGEPRAVARPVWADPPPPGPRPARAWAIALAAVVAVVAALSLFLPWAAAVDVDRAAREWGADPKAAFDRLDRASDLNFLSAQPDLVEGAIAGQLGDYGRARTSFAHALERDPRNWYATLELAALDGLEGRNRSAMLRLDRVSELNPREPTTGVVRNGIASGNPVTPQKLQDAFVKRYCERLGRSPTARGCG